MSEETIDARQCDWREEAEYELTRIITLSVRLGLSKADAKMLCWGCGLDYRKVNGGNGNVERI